MEYLREIEIGEAAEALLLEIGVDSGL
jgi:hypothetical protein